MTSASRFLPVSTSTPAISAKSKEEKKLLKELTGKFFSTIDELDHATKVKSTQEVEKYYAETKSVLDEVIAVRIM
ncbi:hypothetical protein J5N97_011648 [Dioscorea zingiberensis]|uniref:Uncharacterized protein n=1 Tax=Dioscorea zingiberensis TaxID=325984 RepID=A0A9D5D3G2_9LILI|nr:hypothetical protein J5N97_011648 [Dioscorea zingiberensis]